MALPHEIVQTLGPQGFGKRRGGHGGSFKG
jgi:hypothetical protein